MIYDGFLFFNELDLLEIRLNELSGIIDKFILVESTVTHASKEKPLYFLENKDRFSKFSDQIIHVIVDDTPDLPVSRGRSNIYHNRHDIEHWQRNQIARGLLDCDPNDIVMVSDVDEIPSAKSIIDLKEILEENPKINVSFNQRFFYYYINGLNVQNEQEVPWHGTTACLHRNFNNAQSLRENKGSNKTVLKAGWHFSYVGGVQEIINKIESYSHAEFDNAFIKSEKRLEDRINRGIDLFDRPGKPQQVYVELDESFPRHVLLNQEKYSSLIRTIPTK
jgi:beta-1,4-mannosyl-glycoprotein beta-1,4-N-acetylglucosaminyltransferase